MESETQWLVSGSLAAPCRLPLARGLRGRHAHPLAVGPDFPDRIDPITGHLKLL